MVKKSTPGTLLTPEEFALDVSSGQQDYKQLETRTKRNEEVMALLVVVLFIGFGVMIFTLALMVVDGYRAREDSYQLLRDQTVRQNMIIELMAAKLKVQIPSGL